MKGAKAVRKPARAPKVATQKKGAPALATSAPLPLGLDTLAALHALDVDWAEGKRGAPQVKAGTRALASLAFQLVDLTETADDVPARALAHLAVARVVTGEPLTEEQALIAASLGYEREARQLAEMLPAGMPLRLYFLRDDAPLEALARRERDPGLAHYLWVRRLPELGTSERARRLARLQDLPVPRLHELVTRLRVRDFDTDQALSVAASLLVLGEAAASTGNTDVEDRLRAKTPAGKREEALLAKVKRLEARFDVSRRGLLPAFEQQLAQVGTPGRYFLDAPIERSWFQGVFYSAQYRLSLHLLDGRAAPDTAAAYTRALGTPASAAGKDFQTWISQLTASRKGQQVDAALMKSLTELQVFGPAPLLRVIEELQDAADWGDPALSTMTRRIAGRMDSRPNHRLQLGTLAHEALYDVPLSEKLHRAALDAMGAPHLAEWLAWLDRDTAALQALVHSPDPDVRGSNRLQAISHLLEAGALKPEALLDTLRPVLAAVDDNWGFIQRSVELLEQHGRRAEARDLLTKWLATRQDSQAFEVVFARTELARTLQAEGKLAEAWEAVEPAMKSQQFDALRRAALLSQALGESARAQTLAEGAAERYPGAKSLSLLAELHWLAGRPTEAAEALAHPKRSVRLVDWRWRIGERFASVYAARPAPEGMTAFQALEQQKVGASELGQLPVEVNKAGNPALAFAMQSRLRAPGLQQLELLLRAYGYQKAAKSEPEALAWLKSAVPERMREPMSMFAFAEQEDAVLWDVVPVSDATGETADYVWLMRAAASTRSHDTTPARQQALTQRFSADRPGFYHQLGRHLLGQVPEEAARAAATTPKNREELPFFLGLKAQADGRFEDAVAWYRNCVETGNPRNGEYRWALAELNRMRQAERSVALMKQAAR
ncbi:hypothetical protein [Melittangium boletus]|uniref:hypothetical protein n=1 Tax=Melittangium boletus TaxID=83453 RepID=UPI003DA5B32C